MTHKVMTKGDVILFAEHLGDAVLAGCPFTDDQLTYIAMFFTIENPNFEEGEFIRRVKKRASEVQR